MQAPNKYGEAFRRYDTVQPITALLSAYLVESPLTTTPGLVAARGLQTTGWSLFVIGGVFEQRCVYAYSSGLSVNVN